MRQTAFTLGSLAALLCVTAMGSAATIHAQSTAFYYGPQLPSELRRAYDQVVVEPDNLRAPLEVASTGALLIAYVSVGEVNQAHAADLAPSWVLARNAGWSSSVMDVSHPDYRAYVLARVDRLWAAGYRGFFLDTLDSYQLATRDPQRREQLRSAICLLIHALAQRHPEARLLLNRGFELLPDVHKHVHGIVAESLFDRWDAAHSAYVRVPEQDRAWLLGKLREVRKRYDMPVVVIDYRPPSERSAARETAHKIVRLGFSAWVTDGSLTTIGVGAVEIMPRRVLILSRAAQSGDAHADEAPRPSETARWLGPVLEYLGYVPEYQSLDDELPQDELTGRYAGVISVVNGAVPAQYAAWILHQVRAGVRVALFAGLGFAADSDTARALGIEALPFARPGDAQREPVSIARQDALIGFEAEATPHALESAPVRLVGAGVERHLELRTGHGEVATAVATTSWGGVALSHVFALRGLYGQRAWVLDPFAFLSRALRLPELPVPDMTTESGRRVAMFAIDAEGLGQPARMRGRPAVWSVLQREILSKTPWVHAIDVDGGRATQQDHKAASALQAVAKLYPSALRASHTAFDGPHRSLTELPALYDASAGATPIAAPMADDGYYLRGAADGYAFRRVLEAFEHTDAPRRLRPLAVHYHGYVASSPSGLEALQAVYAWLRERSVFVVRVPDYFERVRAFREQLILRHSDGSFEIRGGDALRTLRVPAGLGLPNLAASSGVATVSSLPQGTYVTFSVGGKRRLQLGSAGLHRPHLTATNARVDLFEVTDANEHAPELRIALTADEPIELRLAGLPDSGRCRLQLQDRTVSATADARGLVTLQLPEHAFGPARFVCAAGAQT